MKKHISLCFLCCCLSGLSHAQIYLKGYTGYALSMGNEKLTLTEIVNNKRNESAYQLKLGQGINLGLSIGYALNKNIAFEITGNTQLFSKFSYSNNFTYYDPEGNYWWSYKGFFGDLEYSSTMFQVSPQVVFKSDPYNQCTFYLKAGPNFMHVTHKRTTRTLYNSILSTTEYSGNINTGIQYSFGTEYKLSKNICVFAELTTVNLRYTFKRGKILRFEIDGEDSLSELDSTELTGLNERIMFNHVGLNVGMKYIFW